MRNVKVYNSFLKNINYSFKIKFLKVSLIRTYIFNFNVDDNSTYYRKANVVRKISLKGRERAFLLDKSFNFNFDLSKVGISNIDRIISEYVANDSLGTDLSNNSFDIVGKKKKKIITSDSVISKIRRDEIVTMYFDDDMLSNILLLNKKNNHDYFVNI